ncbi:hypothetical protein Tco_0077309 [Tanacetum coccineum]
MAKIQEVPIVDSGFDTEPLEQVKYDAAYNVFSNERQHSKQPESINNTCLVEKVDSNVISNSPDMCNDDIKTNQNTEECDDECVALANLIANLKLNIDENKKIQKQLKKSNASLTHELKECKSILAETSRTLKESNSTRDSFLIALQSKQTGLETYMTLNDCTIDYDKLERKLNETLGLLSQKEINIKEGLKLKASEISVDLKLKEEKDMTKIYFNGKAMLATGRYAQWQSRFLRYINTRPNGDALRKCILEGPYTPSTVTIPTVHSIENLHKFQNKLREIAKPITPPTKNLALIAKYFKKIYKPTNNNLITSLNSRNKNVDNSSRYKNDNLTGQFRNQMTVTVAGSRETISSQETKRVKDYTYHKEKMLLCKQAEKGVSLQAKQADWLEDMDQEVPIADSVEKVDSNVIPNSPDMCNDDIKTDQNAEECDNERVALANLIANLNLDIDENKKIQKNKNVDNSSRYKNDNLTGQVLENKYDSDWAWSRETISSQETKRVKDYTYHKEKMLLCKQAEKGVSLQAKQADWLEDMDQEVPIADSGSDTEPLEQVDSNVIPNSPDMCNDDIKTDQNAEECDNERVALANLIANLNLDIDENKKIQKCRGKGCIVMSFPKSPDMCNDDIKTDQNAKECDDERVALANLISNLKLDIDENKKIQKQLNKANASLTHELKECKSILAETSRTLKESNSTRDSCLIALQSLVKDKTKVITDLKLKEEKDIDKIISWKKQCLQREDMHSPYTTLNVTKFQLNKNVDNSSRYKNDNLTGQFRNQMTVTVAGSRETISSQETKRVKDYTYHKEKMLLCKQAEKGVSLQAKQADWLEDMDQEVPIADSVEKVDSNVIPNSPDMCNDDIKTDQNAKECDDERVALANLIANLKLDIDENKKIRKQLKKANASLTHELKECKSILASANPILRSLILLGIVV